VTGKRMLVSLLVIGSVECVVASSFEQRDQPHTETMGVTGTIDEGGYDLNRSAFTQTTGPLVGSLRR